MATAVRIPSLFILKHTRHGCEYLRSSGLEEEDCTERPDPVEGAHLYFSNLQVLYHEYRTKKYNIHKPIHNHLLTFPNIMYYM